MDKLLGIDITDALACIKETLEQSKTWVISPDILLVQRYLTLYHIKGIVLFDRIVLP